MGLFRVPGHPKHRVFATLPPDYLAFAWAYRESAKVLASHFAEVETMLPAPVVFLFRHALEVFIKGLLITFGQLIGVEKTEVLKRSHSLTEHIDDLRALASTMGRRLSTDLEDYIGQKYEYDPNSQTWRYPEVRRDDKKLAPSKATEEFDLKHFVEASENALNELEEMGWELNSIEQSRLLKELGINE